MMKTVEQLASKIDRDFSDILQLPYPVFSDAEMKRRLDLVDQVLADKEIDALLIAEWMRAGNATGWLTGWPVTAEAITAYRPGAPMMLYVQHFNHIPLAKKLAPSATVSWGHRSGVAEARNWIGRQGAKRLGVIGRLPIKQVNELSESFELIDMNKEYAQLRLVKSEEEIRWLRLAAGLTDLGVTALAENAREGLSERKLGPIVETPFLPYGATSFLHYFLTAAMASSDAAAPRQFPSTRELAVGDVLSTEISADFWGYTGQVLRTFFIGTEPTPLFRELHQIADTTLDSVLKSIRPGAHARDLVDASNVIEEAGFTIIDDLVHGYGGGYLPPILGSKSRPAANEIPDLTLKPGMALVVQPNVVTLDQSAGVQTGHLVLVTQDGYEPLQSFPRGYHILR